MPDFPMIEGQRLKTYGGQSGTSRGKATVASGTNNVKGAWVEVVSSTDFDAVGIVVHLVAESGGPRAMLDIGIGGEGSEEVLVFDLYISGGRSYGYGASLPIPVPIPAGSRLSIRHQSNSGTIGVINATITIVSQGFLPSQPLGRATTYGADTSDTTGVAVDPGGVVHTKGSWAELVASTTNPIKWLIIAANRGSATAMVVGSWLIDIAIGAAESEEAIIEDLVSTTESWVDTHSPCFYGPFPCNIPAGTRISARAQSDDTAEASRKVDIVLYGFD